MGLSTVVPHRLFTQIILKFHQMSLHNGLSMLSLLLWEDYFMRVKKINKNGEHTGDHYDYGDRYYDPDRGPDKRKNGNKKSYIVTNMHERHHEISRMLLLGMQNVEIAKQLDCTEQSVSQVRNSPVVQDKLAIMKAARDVGAVDISKQILAMAPIALDRIKESLETGRVLGKEASASEIVKQANGIIDRVEGKPTQRVDMRGQHVHFSLEDIDKIKERAKKLSGAIPVEGTVINV